MDAVSLHNVRKSFGELAAVNDLTLRVPEGSIYGFIGPNGSGKTTTLRLVLNIIMPDDGRIEVFGEEMRGACDARIGYLPEERGLYKKMKVLDVLRFFADLKGTPDSKDRARQWLERLDLADWANKKVETLSKGMSQKVQFIAAVLSEPRLLILDEPFTGLDPVNLDVLREAVLEMRDAGSTIIFSTHDMAIAERLCDYIFMIHKGEKVLDGTLKTIREQFSKDTIRFELAERVARLEGIDGVERVVDHGKVQELHMRKGYDSQAVLAEAMRRARVEHFEIVSPTLHDIFVRIARPGEEAEDA